MATKTYRAKALRIAVSQLGVKESPPGSNSGPMVRDYQAATDLGGTGWPWCMAFVQWAFAEAGHPLPYKTASVGNFLAYAKKQGWVVTDPEPGDVICFDFDDLDGPGHGDWPDHTGFVRGVNENSLTTIEGNTAAGDDSNGGQVQQRTRTVQMVEAFVRVPGNLPRPKPARYEIVVGKGKDARVIATRQKRYLIRHPRYLPRLLAKFGRVLIRKPAPEAK